MNLVWASSLDQLWQSPAFPLWVSLAAAILFAFVILFIFFQAEESAANGALPAIALLAIGVALLAAFRISGETGFSTTLDVWAQRPSAASLPALSCLDGLAGDTVETACEKALFASAESSAAAVSYTAMQITNLATNGSSAEMLPDLSALRRAVERDRYGFVAHVLSVRNGCTPSDCAFYKSLSDHKQIAARMTDRTYDGLIERYAPTWNIPITGNAVAGSSPPSLPTGKPMSGDFPSSMSIPAVSIMTPELSPPPSSAAPTPSLKPATPSTAAQTTVPTTTAPVTAKKQGQKRNAAALPPVQLAPLPQSEQN